MFEQAFRNIDDALRKEAGCATELDYSEQTSWLLFLKYLDGLEQDRASEAMLEGRAHSPKISRGDSECTAVLERIKTLLKGN
jgi:type I restriction enzyme M protein